MYTLEEIQENYNNYSDNKIKEIAKNSTGIRKDVIPILNAEIKRRKLNLGLVRWVNYESNSFEGEDREKIKEKIKNSICSECFTEKPLKGYKFNTLKSFILFMDDLTEYRIICSDCGLKKRANTILTTFILGWWSKDGILTTPFTIVSDIYKTIRVNMYSEEIINTFIDRNTAKLRMVLDGKQDLNKILQTFNERKEQLDT